MASIQPYLVRLSFGKEARMQSLKRQALQPVLGRVLILCAALGLLGGCQSRWTRVEYDIAERPMPQSERDLDEECLQMAKLYTSCMVALSTREYASTSNKPTIEKLEAGMRGAKRRAQLLRCQPFWEE